MPTPRLCPAPSQARGALAHWEGDAGPHSGVQGPIPAQLKFSPTCKGNATAVHLNSSGSLGSKWEKFTVIH